MITTPVRPALPWLLVLTVLAIILGIAAGAWVFAAASGQAESAGLGQAVGLPAGTWMATSAG